MIDITSTLTHMNIPVDSPSKAIQAVRVRLTRGASIQKAAADFIKKILDVDITFDDEVKARITSFAIIDNVLKSNCVVDDVDELIKVSVKRADAFLSDPLNRWMFASQTSQTTDSSSMVALVDGVDTKVAVTSAGKIKKGGKEILAMDLYKLHVVDAATPLTNKEFVAVLMKELGMSLAGARTYSYNVAKKMKAA